MSMKQVYETLSTEAAELEAANEAHTKAVRTTVGTKLYRLQTVGLSVMKKVLGARGRHDIPTLLAPKLRQRYCDFLVNCSKHNATPYRWVSLQLKGDVIELYAQDGEKRIVPKEILSLSDRDFAKLVRTHVKKLKEEGRLAAKQLREAELTKSLKSAEADVVKAQAHLKKLQKEQAAMEA